MGSNPSCLWLSPTPQITWLPINTTQCLLSDKTLSLVFIYNYESISDRSIKRLSRLWTSTFTTAKYTLVGCAYYRNPRSKLRFFLNSPANKPVTKAVWASFLRFFYLHLTLGFMTPVYNLDFEWLIFCYMGALKQSHLVHWSYGV